MHPSSRWSSVLWLLLAGLALPGPPGCSSTSIPATGDLALDLKHVDPRVRIQAAKAAADGNRSDLLLDLARNLSDPDPAVRMFTAVALRKLAGQDIEFKPHGTPAEREEGLARWLKWIEDQNATVRIQDDKGVPDGQISKQ